MNSSISGTWPFRRITTAAICFLAATGCGATDINGLPRVLVVSGDALVLVTGTQDSLFATIEGPLVLDVEWQSRNTAVASVTQQGVVTAVGPGRTHIVLRSGAERDSASIAVNDAADVPTKLYSTIAAGGVHTCAIEQNGRTLCWGSNWHGELGFGRPIRFRNMFAPTPVNAVFTALDAGSTHTCALSTDRRIFCWGDNLYGQLGDASRSTRAIPEPVQTTSRFSSLSVGSAIVCGATEVGGAMCWGQIGSRQETRPVAIATTGPLQSISAGGMHACGITAEGILECWGRNDLGQLGDGTREERPQPVRIGGSERFRSVSAGYVHTCAIAANEVLYCWGENLDGRLGIGTPSPVLLPTSVALPGAAREVTAANTHSCAVTAGNEAYCWGDNIYAQLGNGHPPGQSASDYKAFSPVKVIAPGIAFRAITAGTQHSCALTVAGEALCWGFNRSGQLGIGYSAAFRVSGHPVRAFPTAVVDSPGW